MIGALYKAIQDLGALNSNHCALETGLLTRRDLMATFPLVSTADMNQLGMDRTSEPGLSWHRMTDE